MLSEITDQFYAEMADVFFETFDATVNQNIRKITKWSPGTTWCDFYDYPMPRNDAEGTIFRQAVRGAVVQQAQKARAKADQYTVPISPSPTIAFANYPEAKFWERPARPRFILYLTPGTNGAKKTIKITWEFQVWPPEGLI